MNFVRKIVKYLTHPRKIIVYLNSHGFGRLFPDEFYLKCLYRECIGKKLDLENPETFNEKLQWLKLHNRRPEYTVMVDKYAVKDYIAEKIGGEYSIPTLGVWESFDDIDFNALPEKFVLKCTHDSGGLVICRDKSTFDREAARKKICRSLKRNYYWFGREWPYKNVKPQILAEQYMEEKNKRSIAESLNVYKVFTFGGKPRLIQMIQGDKTVHEVIDYFDTEWNLLNLRQNFSNSSEPPDRPQTLERMLRLASELSENLPFLRVDFYEVDGHLYFSEFTFFSDCGLAAFHPEEWDGILGSWIELPKKSSGAINP
ncbi:MAG: glycosyl transferase [Clostridia bacterium]|nr:glycosyl transferase [Clostridia bacterium]